jgi:Tfp pilus assembly protein PilF
MNFYLGNNPDSDGTPYARPFGDWDLIQSLPYTKAGIIDPGEQDRFFFSQILAFLRDDPGRFLRLQLKKAALLVNRVEIRATIDPEFHRRQFAALKFPLPGFALAFALALAGAAALRRGRRGHPALLLFILCQGATVVMSVAASRYRAPFAMATIILAGAGADRLLAAFRARDRKAAGVFALCLAGLGLAYPPVAPRHTDAEELAYLGEAWFKKGDYVKAAEHYKAALREEPDYSQALIGVAGLYQQKGDQASAEAWLKRAVDADPQGYFPRFYWGAALFERGEMEQGVSEMEAATRRRPTWQLGLFKLAEFEDMAGRKNQAIMHLETALRVQPGFREARELLSRIRSEGKEAAPGAAP